MKRERPKKEKKKRRIAQSQCLDYYVRINSIDENGRHHYVYDGELKKEYKMDKMDEEGFFSVLIRSLTGSKQAYRYKVVKEGETFIEEDPYRFSSAISHLR